MGQWKWKPLGISTRNGEKQYAVNGIDFNAIFGYSPAGVGNIKNPEIYFLTVSGKGEDEIGSASYFPGRVESSVDVCGSVTEILKIKQELIDSRGLPNSLERGIAVIFDNLERED